MTQAKARPSPPAATPTPAETSAAPVSVRVLKKYPNRRLYDTQTSGYITLADVRQMVLANESFVVRDAKSGEDLTRSILLQIILEAETGGVPMFTTPVLAHIIRLYGHTMQAMMGSYLEKNVQVFMDMQQRFAEQSGVGVGGAGAGKALGPEVWAQGLMTSYLDQSKSLFVQMQEQMNKQTETLFPAAFTRAPKK